MEWLIEETCFQEDKIVSNGNKFLMGNGYAGVRGTLEEFEKEYLPAVNLAGIYDRVGDGWREPLNAPNPFYAFLIVDGEAYRLPEKPAESHTMGLDFRHGIFSRETTWKTLRGKITLRTERFASLSQVHLFAMRFWVEADFHADVELVTGIDGDVWDIYGPHYDELHFSQSQSRIRTVAVTHENKDKVCVASVSRPEFAAEHHVTEKNKKICQRFSFITEKGTVFSVTKGSAVYTSKDTEDYESMAEKVLDAFEAGGYQKAKEEHIAKWEEKWKTSEIYIEGDQETMRAVNYSLYHLHCIAPRHTDHLSIAARGLSGQTYKGAVFWDTEMFMLDFFLNTEPSVAKTLLKYRVETLSGALKKAKEYGYDGAFYAWESQEGGYDACTDYNVTDVFTGRPMRTFFRDKQVHISSAVVYGIRRYMDRTGDTSLLAEGGAKTVVECAKFYYSLLLKKVSGDKYEIHDVIGPDEYHERVNNNGYTNRMAKLVFDTAVEVLETQKYLKEEYDVDSLISRFQDASQHLYIPEKNEDGVIPQFDGYFQLEDVSIETVRSRKLNDKEYWGGAYGIASHTQVIKQADVVTWLNLFSGEFDQETLLKNWNFYEPRTEHGSSLSACMYAILACKCKMSDKAYPLFMKSAKADLVGGGKEWAGLVYIGGTHPAAAGGAYMTVVNGFAGLSCEKGEIKINPSLPADWKKLRFFVKYQNKLYQVEITPEESEITLCD